VWGSWALDRKAWPEAAEAFTRGQKAARRLSRIQLGRQHKESWLREASGFGAGAAFSLAKCDSLKQAVVALDESRALLLSDAIERDRTAFERLEMLGKADLVRRYRGLAERLHSLEQLQAGYDSMMFDKVSGTGQASSADMQALSEAFDAVIKEIRCVEGYEGFLKSITFEEVVTSAAESPLAYLGSTDQGGLWLVVEPGSEQLVHVIWLPQLTEAEVESQVRTYLDSYEARKIDPEGWTHSLDRTTHWLWDACMGPLLDDLAKASEVVLVPTGLLGMLPLHAAWIRDVATPCGRRYALDVLRIRYVPSARVLREASRAAGQVSGDSALVVDDPGCDDAPLQYSANESDAVRRAFPQVRYVGKHQATREVVLDALSTASVAHLSCHGTASVDQPLDSSLQMADGDLTLREIMYRRAVRASVGRLTVLSACETAVGGADLPDEVVNLSTGFLQAGFAGVIGTLWPVPEASTMLLMVEFYRLWQMEHLEPAEALRQAQIRVRDWTNKEIRDRFPTVHELSGATIPREARTFWESARRHADPYHWAAFCFVGA
jgi:CHAT domain-containing protein